MIVLLLLASEGVKADFLSLRKKDLRIHCRQHPGYFLIKSKGQSKVSLSTGTKSNLVLTGNILLACNIPFFDGIILKFVCPVSKILNPFYWSVKYCRGNRSVTHSNTAGSVLTLS